MTTETTRGIVAAVAGIAALLFIGDEAVAALDLDNADAGDLDPTGDVTLGRCMRTPGRGGYKYWAQLDPTQSHWTPVSSEHPLCKNQFEPGIFIDGAKR